MPDKVNLISFDIDVDKAIKDAQQLKKEYEDLKSKTLELKKSEGEISNPRQI